MGALEKINLLSVILSIITFGALGFVVYFNNKKSATNRAFLFFTLIGIIWNIANYLSYQFDSSVAILWLARATIFFAVWYVFSIFNFIYIFPKEKIALPKNYKLGLIPFITFVSFLTLTPLVFNKIEHIFLNGKNIKVVNGPGMAFFGLTVVGLIISAVFLLIKKRSKAEGIERNQYEFVLTGVSATFFLHIIFNFIFPSFLNDLRFISMGGVFTFPFIVFTTYAILKYKLFNLKVIATEFLTFGLWIVLLVRTFLAESKTDKIVGGVVFSATVVFGVMLIKSVINEVKTREELQRLYSDLKIADEKLKKVDEEKSEFIFITSHQLRTPMTVIKGYISMILEGDFGKLSGKLKKVLLKIYISNERLVKIINDLLDLSRIERGKMDYHFKKVSFAQIVKEAVAELAPAAKDKKIKIVFNSKSKLPDIYADEDYTRQVAVNLIDNAIKYSDKGEIKIEIEPNENGDKLVLSVRDKGIGISGDVLPFIFQRYTREERMFSKAIKGMGLGLYIAKKIIDGQNGRIWAESEGAGRGATFFVELGVAG